MRIVVLGTAAGGGFPQWDCRCGLCRRAGAPGVPARSQDGVAVCAADGHWYLFNASPDLRAQLVGTPALRPGPGQAGVSVRGVFLTDAELDHTVGLAELRGAPGLRVWASAPVLCALGQEFGLRRVLDRYADWQWCSVRAGQRLSVSGLDITVAAISGKRPRYARHAPDRPDWVIAYRIRDPVTGGVLVYAPCLAGWPASLDEVLTGASLVLLDGTFYTADELSRATGRPSPPGAGVSSPMGHLPISGPGGSLDHIRDRPGPRWAYTHLNNTNPLLDAGSAQRRALDAAGVAVLDDGTELHI
jgi:pyrroloquinoline quinone biosynthesis protein B